jgi:cold shock protein
LDFEVAMDGTLDVDRSFDISLITLTHSLSLSLVRTLSSMSERHSLKAVTHGPQRGDVNADLAIYSVVKWFNPKRGFGFVVLSDGTGEAFLHRNILARCGFDAVEPCAVLKVRVVRGDPRPKIIEVLSVDSSAVALTSRYEKARPGPRATPETGTVKWWQAGRGYGYIARDGGGRDAFFHVSSLNRQRVFRLSDGQRVVMDVVEGRKGPKATKIRLILPASRLEDQSNE